MSCLCVRTSVQRTHDSMTVYGSVCVSVCPEMGDLTLPVVLVGLRYFNEKLQLCTPRRTRDLYMWRARSRSLIGSLSCTSTLPVFVLTLFLIHYYPLAHAQCMICRSPDRRVEELEHTSITLQVQNDMRTWSGCVMYFRTNTWSGCCTSGQTRRYLWPQRCSGPCPRGFRSVLAGA